MSYYTVKDAFATSPQYAALMQNAARQKATDPNVLRIANIAPTTATKPVVAPETNKTGVNIPIWAYVAGGVAVLGILYLMVKK